MADYFILDSGAAGTLARIGGLDALTAGGTRFVIMQQTLDELLAAGTPANVRSAFFQRVGRVRFNPPSRNRASG
jgi:hypothetical protein